MTATTGQVTGVTLGNGKPDTVNVDTGGPDGTDALWDRPGTLTAGDVVVIEQYGSQWLVVACLSRKVAPPDLTPVIDFVTTSPSDGKPTSLPVRRADSTDAKPHLTFVYSDGTPPVIPTGSNTQAFTATGGGTWDEVNKYRAGIVRQGVYDDPSFQHRAFGLWFLPSTIAVAMAGRTVTRCDVTVTRKDGMGAGKPVDIQLYTHGYTTPPGDQPVMLNVGTEPGAPAGAQAKFTLPAATANGIAAGTVVGLGITGGGYCGYLTDLTLTFYY